MKNLARNIAIAITLLAVFIIGCSNDIGGSLGNSSLIAALLQQSSAGSDGNIKQLKFIATSDDGLVSFENSRTILPGALNADELTFYYWGSDIINSSNNSGINKPSTITFNKDGDNPNTGTIPVNLTVSAYKLKLAAVITANGLPAITDEDTAAQAILKVQEKAVVYGVADVDLRFNQEVKFYLSPSNIEGTGTVDILVRTEDGWKPDNSYSITVRLEDKFTGAEISTVMDGGKHKFCDTDTTQIWYELGDDWSAPAKNTTAGAHAKDPTSSKGIKDGLVEYKIAGVKAGTYNLVFEFWNSTTPGSGKHIYYTDTVMVLTGQISNKTSYGKKVTVGGAERYILEIPEVIGTAPVPPANLRVGYADPSSRTDEKFVATFEWDDMATNEEYYILELLDLTNETCTARTASDTNESNKTEFTDDVYSGLLKIAADYPNDNATKELALSTADATPASHTTAAGWTTLATACHPANAKVFRETIYQDFNEIYCAGSLNKNSTSVSLYLDLGHTYVARLTCVNDWNKENYNSAFDKENQATGSELSWIYTNTASLTTVDPRTVVKNINTNGLTGETVSTTKWAEAPYAINRFRLDYSLNGGEFLRLKDDGFGLPANEATWPESPNVIKDIDGGNIQGYLTYYDSVKPDGKELIDPTIWAKSNTENSNQKQKVYFGGSSDAKFISLYKDKKLSWKGWYKEYVKTENLYSYINWSNDAGTTDTKAETDSYVLSKFGMINSNAKSKVHDAASATDSEDGIVHSNKVLSRTNYYEGGNLYLVASYGSNSGLVNIHDHFVYNLYSQNIRAFKLKFDSPSEKNSSYPYTTSASADTGIITDTEGTAITSVADTSGTSYASSYTDGEVKEGATFYVSTYWTELSFLVVEKELASAGSDIYKKVEFEILNSKGFPSGEKPVVVKKTFVVADTTTGTGTEIVSGVSTTAPAAGIGDPLNLKTDSEDATHTAYYVNVPVSSFTSGQKYTVKIRAYTNEYKKDGYERTLNFEVREPEYDMTADANFTALAAYTDETVDGTTYYWKQDGIYKATEFKSPKEGSSWNAINPTNNKLYTMNASVTPAF